MDVKDLQFELMKAIDCFTENYQKELLNADMDEKTEELLSKLGAYTKHTFDIFQNEIVKYLSQK